MYVYHHLCAGRTHHNKQPVPTKHLHTWPLSLLGTFRAGRVSTNLDYFVMGDAMATLVEQVDIIEDARQKGHVLVQAIFVPQETAH